MGYFLLFFGLAAIIVWVIYYVLMRLLAKHPSDFLSKFLGWMGLASFIFGIFIAPSSDNSKKSESHSSSHQTSKQTKPKANKNSKYISNKKYNADQGNNNYKMLDADSIGSKKYVGQSIHLPKAKIVRIDKEHNGVWIQPTTDTNSNLMGGNVQAYKFPDLDKYSEGDSVDIEGILLGKQKSLVTGSDTDDRYATIDVQDIK